MAELLKVATFSDMEGRRIERRYYALADGRRVTLEGFDGAEWDQMLAAAEAQEPEAAAEEPESGISVIDDAMIEAKFALKREAIEFVKANPTASFEEVVALSANSLLNGAALLTLYQGGAFAQGLIPANTWEAFRAFLVAVPTERLMEI